VIQFFWHDVEPSFPSSANPAYIAWLTRVVDTFDRKVASLEYIFCTDDYLLQINIDYLSHDYYTDVISFPYHEEGEDIHGEIYISLDRVRENSSSLEIPMLTELQRVMAHGLLHFLGLHDDTDEHKQNMRIAEDKALALFNLSI